MSGTAAKLLKRKAVHVYSNSPPTPVQMTPTHINLNVREAENRRLKSELLEKKVHISYMENDLKTKDNLLENKETTINRLKREVQQLEGLQGLEETVKYLQEKEFQQQEERKKLQLKVKELSGLNDTVQKLEEENLSLHEQNNALESKVISLEDVANNNEQLQKLIDEQNGRIVELEKDVQMKLAALKEMEELREANALRTEQIHQLYQEQIEFLEEKLSKADTSGEVLSEACIEKQVQELETELHTVKVSNEEKTASLETNILNLKEQCDTLILQRDERETNHANQLQKLENDMSEKHLQFETAKKNIVDLRDRLATEEEKYNSEKEKHSLVISELQCTISLCMTETANLKEKLEETMDDYDRSLNEKNDLRKSLKERDVELGALRLESEENTATYLKELESEREVVRTLNVRLSSSDALKAAMNREIEEMQECVSQLEKSLEASKVNAIKNDKESEQSIELKNVQICQLNTKIEMMSMKMLGMEENISLLTREKGEMADEIKRRLKQIERNKVELQGVIDSRDQYAKCLVQLEEKLDAELKQKELVNLKLTDFGKNNAEITAELQTSIGCLAENSFLLGGRLESLEKIVLVELSEFQDLNQQNEKEIMRLEEEGFCWKRISTEKDIEITKLNGELVGLSDALSIGKSLADQYRCEIETKSAEILRQSEQFSSELRIKSRKLEEVKFFMEENGEKIDEERNQSASLRMKITSEVENLNRILKAVEGQLERAEEDVRKSSKTNEKLRDEVNQKLAINEDLSDRISRAKKGFEDYRESKETEICSLKVENENFRAELQNWVMKTADFESSTVELERENEKMKSVIDQLEDKLTSLILESNMHESEKFALGTKHELELAEKLEFFRNLWESRSEAMQLHLDCTMKEAELLKTSMGELKQQEAFKRMSMEKELVNVQTKYDSAVAERSKRTQLWDEMKEKAILYKRHYEDQKQKLSDTASLLMDERSNHTKAKIRVDALEKMNISLQEKMKELYRNQKYQQVCKTDRNVHRYFPPNLKKSRLHASLQQMSGPDLSCHSSKSSETFNDSLDNLSDCWNDTIPRHSSYEKLNIASVNTVSVYQGGDNTLQRPKPSRQFTGFQGFACEDEEEIFDHKNLADLKEGTCNVEFGRLTELQRRNTLCQPHLKTSYPVETQMCPPVFDDDELKTGRAVIDEVIVDVSVVSNESPRNSFAGDKVKAIQQAYRKPGRSTPVRALSVKQAAMARSVIKTPASLKRLFRTRRVYKPDRQIEAKQKNISFSIGFSPKQPKVRKRIGSFVTKEPAKPKSPRSSGFMSNTLKIFGKSFGNLTDKSQLLLI